jgi:hypothetical protein
MDKEIREKLLERVRILDMKKKTIHKYNKGRQGWNAWADEALNDLERKKIMLLGQIYVNE